MMLPARTQETGDLRHEINAAKRIKSSSGAVPCAAAASGAAVGDSTLGVHLSSTSTLAFAAEGSSSSSNAKGKAVQGAAVNAQPAPPLGEGKGKGRASAAVTVTSLGLTVRAPTVAGGGGAARGLRAAVDAHSVTADAMAKCWDVVGERLVAARKVVREQGTDGGAKVRVAGGAAMAASAAGAGGGGGIEDGRGRGAKGRGGGRASGGGRSRKVGGFSVGDFGTSEGERFRVTALRARRCCVCICVCFGRVLPVL